MLAAHSAFDCGPETHCLSRWAHVARSERARILDPADWPARAHAYVTTCRWASSPSTRCSGSRPATCAHGWPPGHPSLATMLESLTAQRAQRAGVPRWVEKTPRHLEVPELIAETWPDARIVRIVRDPRDAAVSLTKVPFGTPSLLTNLSLLARMNEASADFYRESAPRPDRALRGPRGRRPSRSCSVSAPSSARTYEPGDGRRPPWRHRRGGRSRVVEGRRDRAARPFAVGSLAD